MVDLSTGDERISGQRWSGHWCWGRRSRSVIRGIVLVVVSVMMLVVLVSFTRGQSHIVQLNHCQLTEHATGTCMKIFRVQYTLFPSSICSMENT